MWISGVWIPETGKCPLECSHSFLRDLQEPGEEKVVASVPTPQTEARRVPMTNQAVGDLNVLSCSLSPSPFKWQL